MALVTLINRTGTAVLLFLSLYLESILGFTFNQIAIVLSCAGIGSFLGTFIGGKFVEKVGYYYVMVWSLILTGFSFFMVMQISNFYGVCAGILVAMLCGDAFRPASYTATRAYSSEDNRARSIGLVRLAINLGFGIGPFLAGIFAEFFSYDYVFILDGTTCFLAAIAVLIFLPRYKVSAEDKVNIDNAESALQNKKYMFFLAMMFLASVAFFQLFTTFPVFLKDQFSMTESIVGIVMGMNGVIIVLAEMPLVYKLEKKNPLILVSLGTSLVCLAFFLFSFGSSWFYLPFIAMLFITFGEMIDFPFSSSWALNQANKDNAGNYMKYYSMTFSLSQVLAPLLGFKLIEYFGYSMHWGIMCGLLLISALGIYKISKN